MTQRRTAIVLTMLCAFISSAVLASSALAATEGTTAFTCSPTAATKTFKDEHCLTKGTGTENKIGHTPIVGGTTIVGSNAKTASSTTAAAPINLTWTWASIALEVQCSAAALEGTLENALSGERHSIKGSNINISYTGCVVLRPEGKECVIREGAIRFKSLSAVSTNSSIVFSPPASGIFGELTTEKCTVAAINGTFPITGNLPATPKGATLETTDAGTTPDLVVAGGRGGLTQTVTLRMSGAEGKPIVATGPPYLSD